MSPYWQCDQCKKWFEYQRVTTSCTVDHGGACCHLYDTPALPPKPSLLKRILNRVRPDV